MNPSRSPRPARPALRFAAALLACGTGSVTVRGEPPPPPAPGFGATILEAADAIVLGKAWVVAKVTVKGTSVAKVETERAIKGAAPTSFTLFVGGPRNTDDPKAPSEAWLGARPQRVVLFLRATPNGSGYALDSLFPADGYEGEEKLEVLEEELRILRTADLEARAAKALEHLVRLVGGERPWSRTHGVRELEVLSRRAPGAFDDPSLARLDTLRRGLRDRSERAVLAAVLDRLDPDGTRREAGAKGSRAVPSDPAAPGRAPRPADEVAPTDPTQTPAYRRARVRFASAGDDAGRVEALAEFARLGKEAAIPDLLLAFGSPSAAARERAAVLLADLGATATWPSLRARHETEPDPAVREAILRASGYFGEDADLPWILEASKGPPLLRGRCFALARIRSERAIDLLRAEAERARTATPCDTATEAFVEYLLGPVFDRTDPARVARRARAPTR